MIRLVINGAKGRMGIKLCSLSAEDMRFNTVATIDAKGVIEGEEHVQSGEFDAIIDFSSDAGTRNAIQLAHKHKTPVFVGTTGLSEDSLEQIRNAAMTIPVMLASNTSIGVAVMNHLAARAAQLFGDAYDIAIVEFHHAAKKDAPSGTALRLLEAVNANKKNEKISKNILSGRVGDIVGEHSIRFCGPGEYLEITHRATTRDLFVMGALRGCAWLVEQKAGMYSMEQALGLDKD